MQCRRCRRHLHRLSDRLVELFPGAIYVAESPQRCSPPFAFLEPDCEGRCPSSLASMQSIHFAIALLHFLALLDMLLS